MLGTIMNQAVDSGILTESDFMTLSESQVISKLEEAFKSKHSKLARLYFTFRNMTFIEHCDQGLPEDEYFCVNLKVKQRYINPLVKSPDGKARRLYELSEKGQTYIDDFKTYEDTAYGCVRLI